MVIPYLSKIYKCIKILWYRKFSNLVSLFQGLPRSLPKNLPQGSPKSLPKTVKSKVECFLMEKTIWSYVK